MLGINENEISTKEISNKKRTVHQLSLSAILFLFARSSGKKIGKGTCFANMIQQYEGFAVFTCNFRRLYVLITICIHMYMYKRIYIYSIYKYYMYMKKI